MDSILHLIICRTYFKMALPSVFGLMVSVVYNLAVYPFYLSHVRTNVRRVVLSGRTSSYVRTYVRTDGTDGTYVRTDGTARSSTTVPSVAYGRTDRYGTGRDRTGPVPAVVPFVRSLRSVTVRFPYRYRYRVGLGYRLGTGTGTVT